MIRFLHAADIHLDSPLLGLERYEGAPVEQMRQATRRAFENLVQLALDEQVHFVLLAGDLYDGDWPDHNTGLYFIKQMNRLREANIPVFLIAGNHDAANRMTRTLRVPDNVHRFSSEQPETRRLEDLGVAIHGQSYATQAVEEDLSRNYPEPIPGLFNIGLLHTSATGRDGHERYAPCTIDALRRRRYDYWALGHIHKREQLHPEEQIHFPGNLQGRHVRETGPKGCLLVTARPGRPVNVEFRPLDVCRWELCETKATDLASAEEVVEQVGEDLRQLRRNCPDRVLAVRVVVSGSCAAHDQLLADVARWTSEIRSLANDSGSEGMWIEKVRFETKPLAEPPPLDGPLGELLTLLEELHGNEALLASFGLELGDLERKLPRELKEGDEAFLLTDPSWLRGQLEEVRAFLFQRLRTEGTRL